ILQGAFCVAPEHVRAVAAPVLRHRLITNFNAEADNVTTDDVIAQLLEEIPVDASDDAERRQLDAVMG
ncbi:MAG: AAA family ATPase, partial [Chloroflexi bacterium]